MQTFLMLHGVNHNMFGKRDPKQYGTITLAQIDEQLADYAVRELKSRGIDLTGLERRPGATLRVKLLSELDHQ